MHHYHLDQYAQGQTAAHRADARAKLICVVAYLVVLISYNRHAVADLAPMAIFPFAMLWCGRIPAMFAIRRVLVMAPFIIVLCLAGVLYERGDQLVVFGPWRFVVASGWLTAADLGLKFFMGLMALTAMMSVTPFSLLLEAMRKMAMPQPLVAQLGFMYRYLFVMMEEASMINLARNFRGAAAAGTGRRLASVGGAIGSMFVKTLDRSQRIYLAMCARGFDGKFRNIAHLHFHWSDLALVLLTAGYLVFCRWAYPLITR